jgi:hypothetical protein
MSHEFPNFARLTGRAESPKVAAPVVGSFGEFLEHHARVKTPDGSYAPYTFEGREALRFVVGIIDRVIGNAVVGPLPSAGDSRHAASGDAAYNGREQTGGTPIQLGGRDPDSESGQAARATISDAPTPTKDVGVRRASISDARLTATGSAQWGKPSAALAARDAAMSSSRQTIHDGPISDARLTATGSAQWGKTILELNLLAYLAGLRFRSVGLFLPDEDLVEGVVDSKFRPDVLDQLPWLNSLITLGKAENASGKTVNRKGLFTCTDGRRKSHGMIHGMRKIPTTFSFDVVIEDEKDDIRPSMSRYLTARMTASDLRFRMSIGTQRYAGAGQNKEFEAGTMHIGVFECPNPKCRHKQNPEENWPGVCRLAIDGTPQPDDPQLCLEGNFRKPVTLSEAKGLSRPGQTTEILRSAQNDNVESTFDLSPVRSPLPSGERAQSEGQIFDFSPDSHFYLACVRCGTELNRHAPEFIAQHPERERLHHWSVRVSQLLVAAISLKQIVADWCNNAVKDPDAMKTFYVDRLGIPRSATQQVDQKILDRARSVEAFELSLTPRRTGGTHSAGSGQVPVPLYFAGLDTGDRCWLTVREVERTANEIRGYNGTDDGHRPPLQGGFRVKRIVWLEQLSAERVRSRVPQVFECLGITALFVDAGPLRDLARDLCFLLNGLTDFRPPPIVDPEHAQIHFPGGLTWDGRLSQWRGMRCAAVEFSLKQGKGIQHKLGVTQDGLFYPIIACNRDETIERVVNELLTASEGVIEMVPTTGRSSVPLDTGENDRNRDGRATRLRTEPAIRLPQRTAGSPRIIETFDAHVIAGSRRDRDADGNAEHFVDGCENHFLLSNAYSALAESVCEHAVAPSTGTMDPDTATTVGRRLARYGLMTRRTMW